MRQSKYSVYIRWSDEDKCFIAFLPEFRQYTHGETYEEAAKSASEVIDLLCDGAKHLPEPHLYGGGHVITLPAHEGRSLAPDWYEKLEKQLVPPSPRQVDRKAAI